MRITTNMMFNQLTKSLHGSMSDIAELNTRLFTGKKINKPSDDVIGSVNAMDYKVNINANEQFQRNIDAASVYLDFNDKSMTSISDSMSKLKAISYQAVNQQQQADRDVFAQQAADYRDFLLTVANSKIGERYMFSGYRTDQKAFAFNAATNHYDYNGDFGEIKVQFDKEVNMAVNVQGSRVFSVPLSKSLPAALFDGTPVSYTEAADPVTGVTTVTVAIGNAGDPDYDTFTYSNVMDMANIMSAAWQYKNIDGADLNADPTLNETIAMHRIKALSVPFDDANKQVLTIQAEVGTRQSEFKDQTTKLDNSTLTLQNALAKTEDADMTETIVDIQQAQTALEALRSSSATLLSQSLFDFLK